VPDQPGPHAIALEDRLPLGGQEDGTWSLAASVERTLPPDEDPGASRTALYTQLRATWRHLDAANRLNWRGEVLGRPYFDREAPVIGLRGRVEHPLAVAPLTLFASASAYGQALGGHGLAWSGTVAGGATWENEINEKTYQAATVTGFARTLSLSAAEARLSRPDPDVFTRYKDQHRHGLRLSYALRHQPWLDTIWSGSVSLATNESLNPFKPDHVSLSADWLQLLGPMVVDVGVTHTRFFEDADRPNARNDTLLRIGLLREWWMPSSRRWEIGAALGYRTLAREWVGVLSMAWHFGNGRGFRDFAPGEAPFADLRARPLFGLPNNGMRDAATH
jgi:hypothetical protein